MHGDSMPVDFEDCYYSDVERWGGCHTPAGNAFPTMMLRHYDAVMRLRPNLGQYYDRPLLNVRPECFRREKQNNAFPSSQP